MSRKSDRLRLGGPVARISPALSVGTEAVHTRATRTRRRTDSCHYALKRTLLPLELCNCETRQ